MRSCFRGKRQSVSYSQGWEMDVLLGSINGLSTEVLGHLLGTDTLVIDVRVFIHVQTVGFSSNRLEERSTTTTRYDRIESASCVEIMNLNF